VNEAALTRPSVPDEAFLIAFNRLAVALRVQEVDPAMKGVYFSALSDLPADALAAGAEAVLREPGRRFFPTAPEWREATLRVLDAAQRAAPVMVLNQDDPRGWVTCPECQDTGYVLEQGGGPLRCDAAVRHGACACGRRGRHDPGMTYTSVCACRATNQAYQRKHHGP